MGNNRFLLILLASFPLLLFGEEKNYLNVCQRAVDSIEMFKNFRSVPALSSFCERVSYEQGLACLTIIQKEYPELYEKLHKFRQNDSIGNPQTYNYGSVGFFSPTTLHYVKVAGDLKKQFGDLSDFHLYEIGGGYGGQCLILALAGGFASYTIVDKSPCMDLARKYLTYHSVKNVHFVNLEEIKTIPTADLVLSDTFFSNCSQDEQEIFSKKVLKPSKNGYLISHHKKDKLNQMLKSLLQMSKEGFVEMDESLIQANRRIIVWKAQKNLNESKKEPVSSSNGITYSIKEGGLGDHLLAYSHAKWASFQLDIPLYYQPFPFSEEFAFSNSEKILEDSPPFQTKLFIKRWKDLSEKASSTLFTIPFFPENKMELDILRPHYPCHFDVDWYDPQFRQAIAKFLAPKRAIPKMEFPKDYVTVAVHVRKGKIEDSSDSSFWWPLKFPPNSYYIEQIQHLSEIYKNQKLYVYIFTDDPNPRSILDQFQKEIGNPSIVFDCKKENGEDVVADFFAMSQFDCLIRPASNFSFTAELLKEYELVFSPTHGKTYADGRRIVNGVKIRYKSLKRDANTFTDSFWAFFGL